MTIFYDNPKRIDGMIDLYFGKLKNHTGLSYVYILIVVEVVGYFNLSVVSLLRTYDYSESNAISWNVCLLINFSEIYKTLIFCILVNRYKLSYYRTFWR